MQTVEGGAPVGNRAALQGHTETVGVRFSQTLTNCISLTIPIVFLSLYQPYFSHYVNCISVISTWHYWKVIQRQLVSSESLQLLNGRFSFISGYEFYDVIFNWIL